MISGQWYHIGEIHRMGVGGNLVVECDTLDPNKLINVSGDFFTKEDDGTLIHYEITEWRNPLAKIMRLDQ